MERTIHEVVAAGELERLAAMLAAAPGLAAARNAAGQTPLHLAAWTGNVAAAELLRTAAAPLDLDARDADARTPLYLAVARQCQEKAAARLCRGTADAQQRLDIARQCLKMAAWLLAQGADPGLPAYEDFDGETPLHMAARWDDAELVRLLLQHGAPTDTRDAHQRTPLALARQFACDQAAALLAAGE